MLFSISFKTQEVYIEVYCCQAISRYFVNVTRDYIKDAILSEEEWTYLEQLIQLLEVGYFHSSLFS